MQYRTLDIIDGLGVEQFELGEEVMAFFAGNPDFFKIDKVVGEDLYSKNGNLYNWHQCRKVVSENAKFFWLPKFRWSDFKKTKIDYDPTNFICIGVGGIYVVEPAEPEDYIKVERCD